MTEGLNGERGGRGREGGSLCSGGAGSQQCVEPATRRGLGRRFQNGTQGARAPHEGASVIWALPGCSRVMDADLCPS